MGGGGGGGGGYQQTVISKPGGGGGNFFTDMGLEKDFLADVRTYLEVMISLALIYTVCHDGMI